MQGREEFIFIDMRASDLPGLHAVPYCPACPAMCTIGYLGRHIKSDGSTAIRWVCDHCEQPLPGDLPRRLIGDTPLDKIPLRLREPKREDELDWPGCVVCARPSFEFHHWAPRSIFSDWPEYIGAHLCKPHHDEWHRRMREHGLRWPGEIAA